MDPSHRNPSSAERMCNSAPSTGVPRSKDIPTIENAIPMRVLFFRHNMSVCNISNLFESYPCSPEYELSWANSEGIKETSGYSNRWFKKRERINNGWILTHKIQTRSRITDQKKWHQQNLIRQTTRTPTQTKCTNMTEAYCKARTCQRRSLGVTVPVHRLHLGWPPKNKVSGCNMSSSESAHRVKCKICIDTNINSI